MNIKQRQESLNCLFLLEARNNHFYKISKPQLKIPSYLKLEESYKLFQKFTAVNLSSKSGSTIPFNNCALSDLAFLVSSDIEAYNSFSIFVFSLHLFFSNK